jgi:flagellin
MSSILTNGSAMVALQTLKSINKNLQMTQGEISTGKSVATAADNSAVWAISKVMESDVKGFKSISDSLALGESTVAVARSAAETVTDLLTDIKAKVVAAQEANVDRTKLQTDISSLRDQITSVVNAAQFNGLNLVNGSSTADMDILASLDRSSDGSVSSSSISVTRQSLAISGSAATAVFGAGAVGAAGDLMTNHTGTTTTADAGNVLVDIASVVDGASYGILLEGVQLDTGGSGTATGTRTFEYVASASDSVQTVAQNLFGQIEAYFNSSTADVDADGNADYVIAMEADGEGFTITNQSGAAFDLTTTENLGGTPGAVAGNTNLGALAAFDVTTDAGAGQALANIDALIDVAVDAAAAFGSVQGRIETQTSFISNLSDSLKVGIGSMIDADMEEASARLQALQTQQQLGVQALSIANQAPQTILQLFR